MGKSSAAMEESVSSTSKVETVVNEGDAGEVPMPFKFVAWAGSADTGFWHRLADFKLDTQKLTEEPISISGTYAFALCNLQSWRINHYQNYIWC